MSVGVNTAGGFTVPEEMSSAIIDLREEYGVFRRESKVVPMSADTKTVPRRTSGLTAYFVDENSAVTESTKGWDQVMLVARKIAALAKYSSELDEDSIISMADDLAGMHFLLRDTAEAARYSDHAISLSPDWPAPYIVKARWLYLRLQGIKYQLFL